MRTYKGYIAFYDAKEIGHNPLKPVKMVCNGYWVAEHNRQVSSYVFADGSHPEMAFSRSRNNTFYLESIN